MNFVRRVFLIFCLILLSTTQSLQAAPTQILEQAAPFFTGFQGTFVLYDENQDRYSVYNEQRSEKRLTPCSTFKIYNSLIALETGVAPDENMTLQWDGQQRFLPVWNQNHTMSSAIKSSVVWYYQELASRIGTERMQKFIDAIPYGNRDISGGITQFWLRSSLQISAKEQVELLRRLYNDELPFSARNTAIIRRIIVQSDENGVVFSGKTGSGSVEGVYSVGWFVGVIEKGNQRYYFATNLEAVDGATGIKARAISLDILKSLDII
ncbi:MAG: class D beta-lactamase [Negativicutes bacterium]|nr:class D beta-lactamase [Negativicutes bacterium]